ncbi:radical SAM protein [Acidobacteriota bacterium]
MGGDTIKGKIEKIEHALDNLSDHETACRLCPRGCRVNRKIEEKGFCKSTNRASYSHAILHFGEEPILSGFFDCSEAAPQGSVRPAGSGTIFFSGCNLKCSFCQNFQLSWFNQGTSVSDEELAEKMLSLQEQGALNINLVSPTHSILPILKSLKTAYSSGLIIPIVYNSNAYERTDVLRYLEGIVDIYLPDLKYFSPGVAEKLSAAPDYFQLASKAIREMYRQQPELILNDFNFALKGAIIRHLVVPGFTEDSLAILEWIAKDLSLSVCISLMSQYNPCFKTPGEIQRVLSSEEYNHVLIRAKKIGFETMFIQPEPTASSSQLNPDFNLEAPFNWS